MPPGTAAQEDDFMRRISDLERRSDNRDEKLDKIMETMTRVSTEVGHLTQSVGSIKTDFNEAVERVAASGRRAADDHKREDEKQFAEFRQTIGAQTAALAELKEWRARVIGTSVALSSVIGIAAEFVTHWMAK